MPCDGSAVPRSHPKAHLFTQGISPMTGQVWGAAPAQHRHQARSHPSRPQLLLLLGRRVCRRSAMPPAGLKASKPVEGRRVKSKMAGSWQHCMHHSACGCYLAAVLQCGCSMHCTAVLVWRAWLQVCDCPVGCYCTVVAHGCTQQQGSACPPASSSRAPAASIARACLRARGLRMESASCQERCCLWSGRQVEAGRVRQAG